MLYFKLKANGMYNTEQQHPMGPNLDTRSPEEILEILHHGQIEALAALTGSYPAMAKAASVMADTIRKGGRIVYAAAGSSGMQALADGLEITPTFNIPLSQILVLRAGGLEDMSAPKGYAEDDEDLAAQDATSIMAQDCVIALAASGNTPYTVRIVNIARERGATTIGLANNPDTKLMTQTDIPILLPTPPEVIAGSTRMGAGTAQKVALNMMSSLMGIQLGHVMDGYMVNVLANNEKLLARAAGIVIGLTDCSDDAAQGALLEAKGNPKLAALLVSGVPDVAAAEALLQKHNGHLRAALAEGAVA